MNENIFKILEVQAREDCVSNALAYAFNQSEGFRKNFLIKICQKDPGAYRKCTAFTRISTGSLGIPDLVLVCESPDKAELVIIENKLKADEGIDQTDRYATEQSVTSLIRRLCPQYPREHVVVSFIFLTLFPDQQPSSDKFMVRRHADLCALYQGSDPDRCLADKLVADWVSLVRAFSSKGQIHSEDKITQKLHDEDELDGGYLYFRTFLTQLQLPANLGIEHFFRESQQGRRYYVALFSKKEWHPAEMKEVNGLWVLDPSNVFNIHLEPQFDVLKKAFSIYLHYEVNPYKIETWVKQNIPADQYAAYVSRRNRFIELFQEKSLKNWVVGGRSNQIAKVQLDFKDATSQEAKSRLESIFWETAATIDGILRTY